MKKQPLNTMMHGAFVLTVAAFIAKLLSAVYRVPLQNLVGDEGFYVYQQVYPLYGIAMTLALTGLPQFISKYVAEFDNLEEQEQGMKDLMSFVSWIALFLWAVIFFFSRGIALLMGDEGLQLSIQVAAFTFLLIPPLTIYRGSLQGQLILVPTAVSQVIEQFLRVGVILIAAASFHFWRWDIYQVSQIAMLGSFVGGLAAVGILVVAHRRQTKTQISWNWETLIHWPKKKLRRRFFIEGGFVSLYSGYLVLLQLFDSFILVNFLEQSGQPIQQARIEKGIFDRGQPLVQLGLVVALALSASFLPMLTRYLKEEEKLNFLFSAKLYLRLTTAIGLAASVGLALVMPYMNYTLFKDQSGNQVLRTFVFSVVLMALIHGYQSIAQSQNHFRQALKAAGMGLIAKLFSTPLLILNFGALGASLGTLLALSIVLLVLIRQEAQEVNAFWTENHFGRRLLGAIGVMVGSILVFYWLFESYFGFVEHRRTALLMTLAGVALGGISFAYSLVYFNVFTREEWLVIPFGKKILRKVGRKNEIR